MRSSRLSARLLQGVLLLFVPPTVVAGGILSLLYFLGVHHHRAALVATLLIGGAAMVVYLAFMVHGMGESLVAALREMQLDTELMATVNPAHRLHIETGDELESLAATINRLGERLSATQASLSSAVAHATEEVTAERTFLAGVLDAARAAIVTLTPDGRVGLANSAARALLTTGFCGGYTTFSTFSLEVVELAMRGAWTTAAAYGLGSLVVGVAAAACGIVVGRTVA